MRYSALRAHFMRIGALLLMSIYVRKKDTKETRQRKAPGKRASEELLAPFGDG